VHHTCGYLVINRTDNLIYSYNHFYFNTTNVSGGVDSHYYHISPWELLKFSVRVFINNIV